MRSPGPQPLTADERERRVIQYLLSLNKGQIAEFRLARMGRIANFRRALMQLIEQMIESRAEILAAGMVMEHAPERPAPEEPKRAPRRRLPLSQRRKPIWVVREGEVLREEAAKTK